MNSVEREREKKKREKEREREITYSNPQIIEQKKKKIEKKKITRPYFFFCLGKKCTGKKNITGNFSPK